MASGMLALAAVSCKDDDQPSLTRVMYLDGDVASMFGVRSTFPVVPFGPAGIRYIDCPWDAPAEIMDFGVFGHGPWTRAMHRIE